ncbi:MAG: DUF4395 family protein [Saprospiraceae bacterium]|nr:DUF4395 family protein [Lewinella sp.]
MKKSKHLSKTRIKRIQEQGYITQSDSEITALAVGNRFAYQLCTTILMLGTITANIPLLSLMMTVAFFGVVLPNHPFDYIYNNLLAKRMGRPKVPPRSPQLKFACTVATIWIGATIYLFYSGLYTAGYISGALLLTVALLVSTLDFCIPSIIYNAVTRNMLSRFAGKSSME